MNPFKDVDITINTVDVKKYLMSLEITEKRNGIRTASINLDHQIANFITVSNGLIVNVDFFYIEDDTTKYNKFYGFINNIKDSIDFMTIECVDPLWKATGETITKVYKSTDAFAGDPVLLLIDLYSYVDLVADVSTIDPSSVVLPEITCDSAYIFEKTNSITDALAYDQYYDPTDKKMHATNSDLYTLYGTTLQVNDNVLNFPDYNDNIFQTINEIELQGVSSDSAYEESFNGTGAQTVFTLGRTPLSTYIYVTVGGVEQVGSVDGASTTYDYLINKQQGFIEFAAGSIPASGTNNVVVNYTATELTSVTVDDEDSQTDNTKRKIVISVKDAITVDDALERARAMIKISKNNFYNFSVNCTNILDLSCRNTVNFNDSSSNTFLNSLYVNSVKWKWPEYYDEVELGTKPFNVDNIFYNTEERVRRLERERQEGQVLTINKISSAGLKLRIDDLVVRRASFGATVYTAGPYYVDNATQLYDSGSNGTWDNLDSVNGTNTISGPHTPGTGYGTSTAGSPQELLLYVDTKLDEYDDNDLNNKVIGVSFDIVGKTTGVGATAITSAQLMINRFPIGDIKTSTTSFTNTDSTITLGGASDEWGTDVSYYNLARDGFGLILKFSNAATSIDLKYVGVTFHYKYDPSSIDIVASATKLEKTDYDAGTDNTVPAVTFTHTVTDELEVTSTI